MKKVAAASPNNLLRRERELRGWSQKEVAERINALGPHYVSRWERGNASPSPYYRQRLCELFGKNARELGFFDEQAGDDQQQPVAAPEKLLREDWGDAPENRSFYGREQEVAQMTRWIATDRCQVVAVLGIGGIGKTHFTLNLAETVRADFAYVFWRSLRNAPPLSEVLHESIEFLSDHRGTPAVADTGGQLSLFIRLLRENRCLIVIDNVESILQSNERAGSYRPGYEDYGSLFLKLGEVRHQSTLLLTSREKPAQIAQLEGTTSKVRLLRLHGLGMTEGREILKEKGLCGTDEQLEHLIYAYSGNPLALKLIAEPVHELFQGDLTAFLLSGETVFGDIRHLLDQQCGRLSTLEQELLYWLGIEREPVSWEALYENISPPPSKSLFFTALDSLQRRSLIEVNAAAHFSLQPVILEYVTDQIVQRITAELQYETCDLFGRLALIKAQAREFVRKNQERLILAPIAQSLLNSFGKKGCENHLQRLLTLLRHHQNLRPSYAAGNLINLLNYLHFDLSGYNFSQLLIQQAVLRGVVLCDVNFAHATFARTIFTDTFGSILSLELSGTLLIAGTINGEVWGWRLADGIPLFVGRGHADYVLSIAFSPTEPLFATGSGDQTIRIWDAANGSCLHILQAQAGQITSVAFSPDGRLLASGGIDGVIRLWNPKDGQCRQILQGPSGEVNCLAFSPSGALLASGGSDHIVRLWDVTTGNVVSLLKGHRDWVLALAFSPDGTLLATSCGSDDRAIHVWNVQEGICLYQAPGHTHRVNSVAFSPDGNFIASGSFDQTVRVWDAKTGQCVRILQGHSGRVRAVRFTADSAAIVSGSEDRTIRLWQIDTGHCLHVFQGYTDQILSVALNSTDTLLASGGEDCIVHLWQVQTGRHLYALQGHNDWIRSVAFSPDGSMLASGSVDMTVRLWETKTGRCIHILRGHWRPVRSVAFSPDGLLLASGSSDGNIRVWETRTGRCLHIAQGHANEIMSIAFSPNGTLLASVGFDCTVRLWETGQFSQIHAMYGHRNRIISVAFSPDSRLLASAELDATIRVWDTSTGECVRILQNDNARIWSIIFSPDGETLICCGERVIQLWNIYTGELSSTLQGHKDWIRASVFNSHGTMLVSGCQDGTIKFWDVSSQSCQRTLRNPRPYERMDITGVSGLSETQKMALLELGAVEQAAL